MRIRIDYTSRFGGWHSLLFSPHRAQKDHICSICGETIPAGSEYLGATSGYGKLHISCGQEART